MIVKIIFDKLKNAKNNSLIRNIPEQKKVIENEIKEL